MKKHLVRFREGWQGETLAKYILSNFAFTSQPSTIADDLGADFFCTIFDSVPDGNNNYLVPRESFAIQIKSNRRSFSISGKREYLKSLLIPFFVGVCNKQTQELEIYSGEYLIPFFVDEPSAEVIEIKLCEINDCNEDYYSRENNKFTLKFPRVDTIGYNRNSPDFKEAIEKLSGVCRTVSRNITRKNNKEFIFIKAFDTSQLLFISNRQLIKSSIDIRLGKIFYELAYVLKHGYIDTDLKKYEKIRDSLAQNL